jgi:hypothetical protein
MTLAYNSLTGRWECAGRSATTGHEVHDLRMRPEDALRTLSWRALLQVLALTVILERGGCVLDTATITHVEPDTVRVLAVWRCGGLTCWSRHV